MEPTPVSKKKKRRRPYIDILKVPLEKLTGWQEVITDLGKLDQSFERTRMTRTARSDFYRTKE